MSSPSQIPVAGNKPVTDTEWHSRLSTREQDAIFLLLDNKLVYASPSGLALLGATEQSQLSGAPADRFFSDAQYGHEALRFTEGAAAQHGVPAARLCYCKTLDGQLIEVEVRVSYFAHGQQAATQLTVRNLMASPLAVAPPVTPKIDKPILLRQPPSRVHEALHHEKEILEMIALDKPLHHILEDVCDRMERLLDNGSVCCVMLLDTDKRHLALGAAPSMPVEFCQEFERLPVGLDSGSCGAAIYHGQVTIVDDIDASPLWQSKRDSVLRHGLHSCWSLPIKTAFKVILGTVDVYHHSSRSPSEDEQALIMDAMDLIALAIDKKNMEQSLEQSEERYRSVVTNLTEGIMVLGPMGKILTCNPSAQRILKIEDPLTAGRRHRYFERIIGEDGTAVRLGDDPASMVFRNGTAIVNLSIGLELRDHTVAWLLVNVLPITDHGSGTVSAVLISFTDTTAFRETQRQLNYIATHDALTGLPNRHQLHQRLLQALSNNQQHKVAVIFLDLDRFKNVNDTAGHAAGDSLLCNVATRLNSCIRTTDMLARLGGDEFVIVAEAFDSAQHLKELAERVLARMREPFLIDGNEYHLGTSIGISVYPHDASDGPTLLRCADSAMYLAKESGRNNYQFFTTELNVRAQHRYTLERNLRRALSEQEFLVFYQPKVCLRTSRIVGAEALIRWQMPDSSLIQPNEFIPISEEIGLILPIGRWVLEQSCRQAKIWRDNFVSDLIISVNISPKQFQDPQLAKFIRQILEETGLPGNALQLEITEGLLMGDVELLLPVFHAIKKLGVSISLDDFGTGFSSLSYLQRFPIDNLKIDRSFISAIPGNHDSVTLTHAIIAMAKALGMSVTAEGVEQIDQMVFLKDSGCQEIQGYYFSKPLSVTEFEDLLAHRTD